MRLRRVVLVGLVAALLVGALAPGVPAARAKGKTHKVGAEGSFPRFSFEPPDIEIATGDKVVWTNNTSAEHHVMPYGGPWDGAEPLHLDADGGKSSFVFKKPGEYLYYCDLTFHGQLLPGDLCAGQCGSITVN
ncbi:MAG TPA: plastocyanin/azurin family copper-binding protein [Actinomycetota bacterium]|nr:plastocyanin/azurin family copper-binding protein [Actinomycetota bacterium]